jgi:predicted dehydrogenase
MRTPLNVGVVGLDADGVAYASALADLPQVSLRWLCDEHSERRQRIGRRFETARLTSDSSHLLRDELLDAIVIARGGCPTLAYAALAGDKHVFTTAPLAYSGADAAKLVRVAAARDRALVVADPLVVQPAAATLKELIESGGLGDVYTLYAERQGIPRARPADQGVWTFGADELSLLLYLVADEPIEIVARGESYVEPDIVDVVFCDLRFATGISAHLHLSWLDPLRIRRLTAIASKRMAVLDSLEPERKLTVYEQRLADGCVGDIHSPQIDVADSVRLDCERLLAAVRSTAPRSDARRAVTVVQVLESVEQSLECEQRASRAVEHGFADHGFADHAFSEHGFAEHGFEGHLELVHIRPPA